MLSDPTDDWYEWRTSHAALGELAAGVAVVAVVMVALLVAPALL